MLRKYNLLGREINYIIPKIRQDLTNTSQITIVNIICKKGNDKEEYMTTAARENGY